LGLANQFLVPLFSKKRKAVGHEFNAPFYQKGAPKKLIAILGV
jgi:hypothetical protein